MQYLESAESRSTHPRFARWVRSSAAVLVTLAAPAVSTSGALTTGLNGTSPAVRFPSGYGVTLAVTVAVTTLAAVVAALIARRDALVAIPVSLGLWLITGLAVVIAGIQLGHTGLAHWGVILVAASIIGAAAGMLLAASPWPAEAHPQAMTMRKPGQTPATAGEDSTERPATSGRDNGKGPMMTRFTTILVALVASLGAIAAMPAAGASVASGHTGPAAQRTGTIGRETPAPGGPRIWHVLVGGQSKDQAIQAEGYYPRVITIDAGDTVVWTLNTKEIHAVAFAGTCEHAWCVPPRCLKVNPDLSPCGPHNYNGVTALDSSGRMVPPQYNWDPSVPRSGTRFSLRFTRPGVNIYFDLSVSGMRGVVIVQPAGTPYPFTQAQYSAQAQQQLRADLAAGDRAASHVRPLTVSAGPGRTHTYHVALGASPPQKARVVLGPAAGSAAHGTAVLREPGTGTSPDPGIAIKVRLAGLAPGSVHAVQVLPGACGAPAATTGLQFSLLFNPPAFTLHHLTAGPGGTATSTTVITQPPNPNGGPALLRIPSAGWFINVAAGPAPDNDATSAACGNIVFHSASVMRDTPRNVHIDVGDTVVWTDDTSNEPHGVTFLAGQPLPPLPDWYMSSPTGNGIRYDGSTYFNSGLLYMADAGRNHSLTLTFTKAGTFPYVDVGDSVLGTQGTVTVAP